MTVPNHATMRKSNTTNSLYKSIILLTVLMLVTLLSACTDSSPKDTSVDSSKRTKETTKSPNAIKPAPLKLPSTAIDRSAFLGSVQATENTVPNCPYLSDETAQSAVKTNWELTRREVSSNSCYWSKNAGFSIKLTIEPLKTAKPIEQRSYNMDSPPVLKRQPEPGQNAHVLFDNTWGRELAYAISFEQDEKLIVIFVTGMNTTTERLVSAAKEVSNRLSNGTLLAASPDNSAALDLCSTWPKSDIEAIIGSSVQITTGDLDCQWESGSNENLKQVRLTIYSGKHYPWDSLLEQGAVDITGLGERGLLERKRKKNNMPAHVLLNALYDQKLVTITTTDTIKDHEASALALALNIDKRFKL